MKITKLGHSCLLLCDIGDKKRRFLIDPGILTVAEHSKLTDIDAVFYTHEHPDHLDIPSLKRILTINNDAVVVTNSSVGALLEAENITFQCLEKTDEDTIMDVLVQAHDGAHAEIFEDFGQVQNTGYLFDGSLYLPGDSLAVPPFPVEVMALVVAGPFCPVRDARRFAEAVSPKVVFPVHDGQLNAIGLEPWQRVVTGIFANSTVKYVHLAAGESYVVPQ